LVGEGTFHGERQITIASRGAGAIEDARADQASYSSGHFAAASRTSGLGGRTWGPLF
jgi:hypothetical protein